MDSNEINYNQTTISSAEKSLVNGCQVRKTYGVPDKSKKEPAAEVPERYSEWFFVKDGKVLSNNGTDV